LRWVAWVDVAAATDPAMNQNVAALRRFSRVHPVAGPAFAPFSPGTVRRHFMRWTSFFATLVSALAGSITAACMAVSGLADIAQGTLFYFAVAGPASFMALWPTR
jgi:hypothetical protein